MEKYRIYRYLDVNNEKTNPFRVLSPFYNMKFKIISSGMLNNKITNSFYNLWEAIKIIDNRPRISILNSKKVVFRKSEKFLCCNFENDDIQPYFYGNLSEAINTVLCPNYNKIIERLKKTYLNKLYDFWKQENVFGSLRLIDNSVNRNNKHLLVYSAFAITKILNEKTKKYAPYPILPNYIGSKNTSNITTMNS